MYRRFIANAADHARLRSTATRSREIGGSETKCCEPINPLPRRSTPQIEACAAAGHSGQNGRQRQQGRGARRVVVSAWKIACDPAPSSGPAMTEVIVVGADHDKFVSMGPSAGRIANTLRTVFSVRGLPSAFDDDRAK